MILSLSSAVRSTLRIVATTLTVLLVLSPVESSLAAEVTFGPGNKYSVQLPDTWTAKLQEDKSVGGEGPGGVMFNVNAQGSKRSPEDYMEGVIGISAKKADYKLIEKGSVQSRSGRKAQLVRYQLDGAKGPTIYVKYFFQLVENQVVTLGFAFISGVSKSAKNDVEAIFDSVKVITGAGQDDSWLTTPAEKSKEDSKATGSDDSKIAGKYVLAGGSDYMELKADGTFSFQMRGESGTGTYTRNGATITLKFSEKDIDDAKLDKDVLVGTDGSRWVKKP